MRRIFVSRDLSSNSINSGLPIEISNDRDHVHVHGHDHVESALDERARAHAECALHELFLGEVGVLHEFGLDEHGHHCHVFQNQDVEPLQRNVKKLEMILLFLTEVFEYLRDEHDHEIEHD